MAAANMKAVKLRIKSVQNTMQITKAMQLVAASKLRKAKERADRCKPYLSTLWQTLTEIANDNTDFQSPYTRATNSDKWLYIVIAGDRGLAGGYNSNLFKYMESERKGKTIEVLPLGKKAVEYFRYKDDVVTFTDEYSEVAKVTLSDCFTVAKSVCEAYKKGEFGHILLCYTDFISMLSQVPQALPLLPLSDLTGEMEQCIPDAMAEREFDPEGLGTLLSAFLRTETKDNRTIFVRRYLMEESVAEVKATVEL